MPPTPTTLSAPHWPPSSASPRPHTTRSSQHRWQRYGPWALVTGASSGIGRALARELAARGLDLVLVARGEEALTALAGELAARHGVAVRLVVADLATAGGVEHLLAEAQAHDVGLLVAAAGFGTSGPFLDGPLDDELAMLDVNCRAVVALCHHMGQRLVARGGGGIVLLGSLVGFQGVPHAAHYAATKAYLQTFAEALHVELAPHGVDVLSSAPGPTHSGFAARAGMRMTQALTPETVARGTLAALGRRATVQPGWLTKVLRWSLVPLPRAMRVRVMGRVMQGMTKDGARGTMGRARATLAVLLLLGLGPGRPRGVGAQEAAAVASAARPAAAQLTGRYRLADITADSGRRVIQQAIEQTTAPLNFVVRRVARGRLTRTNRLPERIMITVLGRPSAASSDGLPAPALRVAFDGQVPAEAPLTGQSVAWRDGEGQTFALSARVVPAAPPAADGARAVVVEQRFTADDGTRENRWTLLPDGRTLRLQVRVTSPRLPVPLAYALDYVRE